MRPFIDESDAWAVGALRHVNPASNQREIETRSFFGISDASWVSIITVCLHLLGKRRSKQGTDRAMVVDADIGQRGTAGGRVL